jgi:hypothetical protein
MTRIMGTLHKDIYTYMIMCSIIIRMRNILDKICRENWNTRFMFINSFWKSCCLWDNVEKYFTVGQATDNNIIQCMHFACWIIKDTDTLELCNTSFPLQQ